MKRGEVCGSAGLALLRVVVLAAGVLGGGGASAAGFERVVLFANEEVEVLDLRYPPGAETPLHTHDAPHRVLYVEAGGTLEIVPGRKSKDGALELVPGGKPNRVTVTAGQTLWLPSQTHLLRNVGATFVRVIEVEIKISSPKTKPEVNP